MTSAAKSGGLVEVADIEILAYQRPLTSAAKSGGLVEVAWLPEGEA